MRRQQISLANELGVGILETRALLAFLPRVALPPLRVVALFSLYCCFLPLSIPFWLGMSALSLAGATAVIL